MSDKPKLVKKHESNTNCDRGNHTYIVTAWQTNGGRQKAIAMRCRHCLMPLDLEELQSAEWVKVQNI